jgi:hypothetical protein
MREARYVSLIPRTTLHSDSEQYLNLFISFSVCPTARHSFTAHRDGKSKDGCDRVPAAVGDPIRLTDQYTMELLVQVRPSGRILDNFKMQHWCRDIKIRRNVLYFALGEPQRYSEISSSFFLDDCLKLVLSSRGQLCPLCPLSLHQMFAVFCCLDRGQLCLN